MIGYLLLIELQRMFDAADAALAKSLGKDGHLARDVPWTTPEYWDELMQILGAENVTVVACTNLTDKDGKVRVRGQILISPAGLARAEEWQRSHSQTSETQTPQPNEGR